jgi:uncharacterized protein (DUF952 family)
MSHIIYHITTAKEWQEAKEKNYYEAPSLQSEGFIHCSKAEQVQGILERYFKGKTALVKLTIDTTKLAHKLQYNFSPSTNEEFPHVYGVINVEAVIETQNL